ncbi:MAG: MarR family transcriptional regulator [Varibaculum sp.]|nr:MarR family transcriptional regulator [Varibaculum sp.]
MSIIEEDSSWEGMLQATRSCWLATNRLLTARHVNVVDYDMLNTLHQVRGKHMFISDLAETVGLTRSGATRAIDRMVSLGLMERELSRDDRRHTIVKLTERGVRFWKTLQCEMIQVLREDMTNQLGSEELEQLLTLAQKRNSSRKKQP